MSESKTGNKSESLQDLVLNGKTSTNTAIGNFIEILDEYSVNSEEKDLQSVIKKIKRAANQMPAAYSVKEIQRCLIKRGQVLNDLMEQYVVEGISQKFPYIFPELFDLKRHLTIESSGNSQKVVRDDTTKDRKEINNRNRAQGLPRITKLEVPLFAYTPILQGDSVVKLGRFTWRTEDSYGDRYSKTTSLEVKLPGEIDVSLRLAYRNAMSHYFSVIANAYATPIIGDLMIDQEKNFKPEIGAIWIPTIESINLKTKKKLIVEKKLVVSRKDLDPAMILTVQDCSYLVTTWTVDDEEPFENYIREFTKGSLKGKM